MVNWSQPQRVPLRRYLGLVSFCLVALTTACVGSMSPTDSKEPSAGKPEFGKAAQGASPVTSPAAASLLSASPVAPSPLSDAEATALMASRQATAIAVQDEHLAATAQAAATVPALPMPAQFLSPCC